MPRITEGIDSERVFCLECQDYMFHVLNWIPDQRLVVFKKDDFSSFLQGGEVISFLKSHKGLKALVEGEEDILKFMSDTLPSNEYFEFEKWMFEQTA
jgi:hypothetical protein